MICEEFSSLFTERTVNYEYNGTYAQKIHIFNSEFSDSVLLYDIVILILHITNASLPCVSLCSCFRRTDKTVRVTDHKHCSQHGSLPAI
jgi:hypothetical protein